MTDYEIGYGKPPKHSQFKKGVCPNPRGRGKRSEPKFETIMANVLSAQVEFRDRGTTKKASRIELLIRKRVAAAIKGDVSSGAQLLKLHAHAKKFGDCGPMIIRVTGGLPPDLKEQQGVDDLVGDIQSGTGK
jgi:hypothetical protein